MRSNENLCLASCPGSGKTRTIVAKMLRCIEQVQREANGEIVVPKGITVDAAAEFLRLLDDAAKVTMNGIVYYGHTLAANHRHISRGLGSRFSWFLIDEFQDTTTSQVELLKEVHGHGRSRFFLVGDTNQSIFGFAGAHPELMGELATHVGARTDIGLVGNYRSSSPILAAAELLCPCKPAMQAVGRNRDFPLAPVHVHCSSALEGVWDYFLPRLDESQIPLGEAAVLAPWWTSLYNLARGLRERDVPVVGPGSRPYKRSRDFAQFAEQACAYLEEPSPEIAAGLQRALFIMLLNLNDSTSWRVYSYEGKKTLFRLLAQAREVRLGYEVAADWLTRTAARVAAILVEDELLSDAEAERLTESAQAMVDDMIRNKVDIQNLSTEQLGLFARPKACLQLLTMHRAKGREFDAVAIVDCHEGKLPHFDAATVEEIEETRRLMYVAATRARKVLMFFTDSSHPKNSPSRFLGPNGLRLVRS
ncbi:MAG: ATP-dependent helicase [Phycisphaerae bacterium]|nr:ATP-dependent helicase [Phycisphaerae bacterium]